MTVKQLRRRKNYSVTNRLKRKVAADMNVGELKKFLDKVDDTTLIVMPDKDNSICSEVGFVKDIVIDALGQLLVVTRERRLQMCGYDSFQGVIIVEPVGN